MRSSLFSIIFLFVINPILSFGQKSYTINGTISKPEISALYFTKSNFFNAKSKSKPEKIAVIKGKFSIKGTITEPIPAFLSVSEDYQKDGAQAKQFILDQGNITIDIKGNISDASVIGSRAHDDIIRYNSEQAPFSMKINAVNQEAQRLSSTGISADSVRSMFRIPFRDANNALNEFQKSFVRNNKDAFISILLISSSIKVNALNPNSKDNCDELFH